MRKALMNIFLTKSIGAAIAVLAVSTADVLAAGAGYRVIDLGSVAEAGSFATGLNDLSQAVGTSFASDAAPPQPFFFDNGRTDLHPAIDQGRVNAINNQGQIIGYGPAVTSDGFETYLAFLLDHCSLTSIGTLGGIDSGALSINNLGQIVGNSTLTPPQLKTCVLDGGCAIFDPTVHAFVYEAGSMHDLHVMAGLNGTNSTANDINDAGQVVGTVDTHGFLYQPGATVELAVAGAKTTVPLALNDSGQVIGCSTDKNNEAHAFMYDNGAWVNLGTLGGTASVARDINKSGTVVGQATLAELRQIIPIEPASLDYVIPQQTIVLGDATWNPINGFPIWHAFVYNNGSMTDLNTLIPAGSGWELEDAAAINARGQIVGNGRFNGATRAYMLVPVPEPDTVVLITTAALLLRFASLRVRSRVGSA